MCNPANWQVYSQGSQPAMSYGGRGYTGHEQLNGFGIINMNARLYDPLLARFLAPDPFVGSGMTNDFNRYVYCRNNPLMFSDPTGESWKSFWSDFGNAFKRDFKKTFLSGDGIEVGWNSQGGVFVNQTRGGQPFGPSLGYNNHQITGGKIENGFHNMKAFGSSNTLVQSVKQAEQVARNSYKNFKSMTSDYQTQISNWVSDTYSLTKDHFYIGMEGEVTRGVQIAVILKNGVGVNIDPYSKVVIEGSLSNKEKLFVMENNDKIKLNDFGAAYYLGVNYNQTIDYSGLSEQRTNTISIGALGVFGVTLNYDNNWNFMSGYGGFDVSGKIAVGYGASGSLKLGFNF